jgi:GTP cyclohydrolase II
MSKLPSPGTGRSGADDLAAIRVDRARTELRHGRAVALLGQPAAGWLLATAVETLSPQRLHDYVQLGLPLQLLLTAERLQALGWPQASTPRALRLAAGATVAQLQALAAVLPGGGDKALLGAARVADAAMQAALALAKRARLTPALLVAELPATEPPSWSAWLDDRLVHRLPAADVAGAAPPGSVLRRVSDAHVPITANEACTLVLYREVDGDAEHVAIVFGQPAADAPVAVRLHSACLTGDLLGSLRCDCGDQLRRAVDHLAQEGGVLLYLAQEGRGTGLANKLRAYRLQDAGLDTLQADRHLGFHADERDFRAAAAMLHDLGHERVNLLTNNPHKIAALRDGGIEVVQRLPLPAPLNIHNARYVQTKQDHAGHLRNDEQLD